MTTFSPSTLDEVEKSSKKIFDLECRILDQEWQIKALEFEVALQKQLRADLLAFTKTIIKT